MSTSVKIIVKVTEVDPDKAHECWQRAFWTGVLPRVGEKIQLPAGNRKKWVGTVSDVVHELTGMMEVNIIRPPVVHLKNCSKDFLESVATDNEWTKM